MTEIKKINNKTEIYKTENDSSLGFTIYGHDIEDFETLKLLLEMICCDGVNGYEVPTVMSITITYEKSEVDL